MTEHNRGMSTFAAFLVGGLIGAGIALLMAPRSGEEVRTMIVDRSEELLDKAKYTAEETRSRAERAIDDVSHQAQEKVSQLRDQGKQMVNTGKDRVDDQVDTAKGRLSH